MKYMTTDQYTNGSGMLDTGDGHSIWWHDWGNKSARTAIFHLHGGPGSGNKDKYKLGYNPKVQRVIFHDQRGCGQSTPFGSTVNNTTQDLVADIERIRTHLTLDKIMVAGGSWGSCLAFMYAITHPDRVLKMLLGGIFLGTKKEADYIQQGGLKTHYPEAWAQYIEVVPEDERNDTVSFYLDKFLKNDKETAEYVRRWCLLEGSAATFDSDYKKDLHESYDIDDGIRSLAILEAHYFKNNCFLTNDFIVKNADKLRHIPIVLMQGRQDHVCPPETAYKIAQAIGKNCHLHIMPGGHARDFVTREVAAAYNFTFLRD